jgi:hypothetical protein
MSKVTLTSEVRRVIATPLIAESMKLAEMLTVEKDIATIRAQFRPRKTRRANPTFTRSTRP